MNRKKFIIKIPKRTKRKIKQIEKIILSSSPPPYPPMPSINSNVHKLTIQRKKPLGEIGNIAFNEWNKKKQRIHQ